MTYISGQWIWQLLLSLLFKTYHYPEYLDDFKAFSINSNEQIITLINDSNTYQTKLSEAISNSMNSFFNTENIDKEDIAELRSSFEDA